MSSSESHDEITPDQLRFEAACFAMQGLLANEGGEDYTRNTLAEIAVEYADALLAALDKGREQ